MSRRAEVVRDKKQAVVVAGFPGSTMHHADRHALELLAEACSDLGSRLFLRIRDELGLAYYVGTQNFTGLTAGFVAFYCGTAPEHAAQVERELLEQAALLARDGLTDIELRRAKAKLLGQKMVARQDLGGLAMTQALDELHGLGHDHVDREDALIEAVTPDDVRRVAAQHLRAEHAVVATVHP